MSKELEALKEIERFIGKNIDNAKEEESWNLGFDIGIIEKALKDYEKQNEYYAKLLESVLNDKEHKALEIIKEKEVNVFIFLHSGDLETYNDMVEDNRKLTQEEYDLLKEVLK